MTVERRMIVGVGDIRAVCLECGRCKARLVSLPDKVEALSSCPACRQPWPETSALVSPLKALLEAIPGARLLESQATDGVKVLLEFDAP